jgi:hypothetical protein
MPGVYQSEKQKINDTLSNLKLTLRGKEMDIEKALKLTSSKDLYRAAVEAERRNVEHEIIRELYRLYYEAVEKENRA